MRHRADGDRQGADPPWKSLGLRQRRKLTRHLAHCEPCRRAARQAGMDESFFRAPTLPAKIAALLPLLPSLRGHRGAAPDTTVTGSLPLAARPLGTRALQAIHALGDPSGPLGGLGREAWLPPLRQRYWRGRGPGWWSGSVAPPARLTIRTLRLLLWGPTVTSEATRSARGLSSVQQAAGLKLHRPAPKRSSGARQAAHRRGPRARTSTVPAGKKSPAAVRRRGGHARAGSAGSSSSENGGNVVMGISGHGLLSTVGGGSAMAKVQSLSPRLNLPGLPALPRAAASLPGSVGPAQVPPVPPAHLPAPTPTPPPGVPAASAVRSAAGSGAQGGPDRRGDGRQPERRGDRPRRLWDTEAIGAWRSLVARTVRVGEVPGSNPGAPIVNPE